MPKPSGDIEISSSSFTCILYKSLSTRKFSKPEDGRYRPKHVVFSIADKNNDLAVYL